MDDYLLCYFQRDVVHTWKSNGKECEKNSWNTEASPDVLRIESHVLGVIVPEYEKRDAILAIHNHPKMFNNFWSLYL